MHYLPIFSLSLSRPLYTQKIDFQIFRDVVDLVEDAREPVLALKDEEEKEPKKKSWQKQAKKQKTVQKKKKVAPKKKAKNEENKENEGMDALI